VLSTLTPTLSRLRERELRADLTLSHEWEREGPDAQRREGEGLTPDTDGQPDASEVYLALTQVYPMRTQSQLMLSQVHSVSSQVD
jgi:hypothetical protein